ncbi:unnamed protein product [Closterium sp. Yama58-4]|nr:unnamed protein product [Closterium sp. Yama58-4]
MGLFGDLPPPSNAPKPPTRANPPPSTSTPSSIPSTPAERPAAVATKTSALKSSLKGRTDSRGEEGTGNLNAGDAGGGSGEGGKTRKRVGMAVADEADGDDIPSTLKPTHDRPTIPPPFPTSLSFPPFSPFLAPFPTSSSPLPAPARRRVRFHTFAEVAEDKVTSAIAKIAAHIGTPAKFKKAAGLARQLLEGGALNSAANSGVNSTDNSAVESGGHAGRFFGVLQAAMGLLQREGGGGAGGMVVGAAGDVGSEYAALIGAAVERKELFAPWQQQQVDVWGLRTVLTHSLRTDDSFQFSKAVSRVQQEVEKLPEAAEEDEREEAGLFAGVAMQGERKEDLLLCIQTATEMCRHKWAQTAIDMLAQHAYDHRRRFTARQRGAIEALWTSVRQQQHERKHGAGRGGTGRLDVTAFERLQRHYEGEAISIRKGLSPSLFVLLLHLDSLYFTRMAQAKADPIPPCVVVLLPDGSARLYDDARLTASTVLADFPRHVLLSTLSTATPRTPLPHAALLKPGRTYYLLAETHRPRAATKVAVDISSLPSPSSSQNSPNVFRKSQTLHASPLSTLSPYSPPLSEGAIPLDYHHGQSRSSPPKSWNEGIAEGYISRTTSTCELRGSRISQSGYNDSIAGVPPSRRHDGHTANPILQELEALEEMTTNGSAYDTRDHQSPVEAPSPILAEQITATRRTPGAPSRKMNKSQTQKNMSVRMAEFPNLGRSIISGGHHMATPSHREEEGAFWKNLDDRTMMFTDTQILVSQKDIEADVSAATPTRAAVIRAGVKVYPRRLPEQVEEPRASDYEHYYSQAFHPRCYNESIMG